MQGNASGGEKFPSGNGRVLIWLIFLRMLARVPRCFQASRSLRLSLYSCKKRARPKQSRLRRNHAVSSSLRNRTIHSRPARRP